MIWFWLADFRSHLIPSGFCMMMMTGTSQTVQNPLLHAVQYWVCTRPSDEPKYLVFRSCLKSLWHHCSSCGSIVTNTQETTSGSCVTVKLFCINGHKTQWNSQPLINNMPAGNLLTSAAILFSGNTFYRVSQVSSLLNLQFFSKATFYGIQNKFLFPVIDKA